MLENSIHKKNWFHSNWKWLTTALIIVFGIALFFSTGMNNVTADLTKAYSDVELYNNALDKVKADTTAINILGEIEPIDNLAILEGHVIYSEDNTSVKSSIRIIGSKGKGKLDIKASKTNSIWIYESIKVRIKQPKEQQQTIVILIDNK